ncbi:MAG: diacylglycerol kinase family lipid kinase [Nitrospiraceae bacterium]|nr:MAG: diacylglycerol kinase family lipid kinase [Nitrospiraceae bacterium]
MNVSLVVNPLAGNRAFKHIDRIKQLLAERTSLSTFITEKRGDALEFARSVSAPDRILVASGDGTINEVLNGLMNSDNPDQHRIPVAVIPLGTTNVLAKELGIPETIESAVNLALQGEAKRVSLGRINGHYFSLMAGIGFDGETVMGVKNNFVKKMSGKAAHILSGLKVLQHYHPPLITVRTDKDEYSACTAVISNARCYGGHFYVTPDASITEAVLDVCLFKGRTRRSLLRFIAGVLSRRHSRYDDVTIVKAGEVEVTSEGTVHVQIDGDYFGTLPVTIDVVADAASLVW